MGGQSPRDELANTYAENSQELGSGSTILRPLRGSTVTILH